EDVLERPVARREVEELPAARLERREEARHDLVRALDDEARGPLARLGLLDPLDLRERVEVGGRVGLDLDDRVAAEAPDELARSPERDHLALVDDRDPVAESLGLVREVRRQQQGSALGLDLREELPRLAARAGIEPRRRLV